MLVTDTGGKLAPGWNSWQNSKPAENLVFLWRCGARKLFHHHYL